MKVLLAFYIFPLYLNIMGKSYYHIVAVEQFDHCILFVLLEVVKNWNPQWFFLPEMLVDAKCAMHIFRYESSFWAGLKVSSSQAYLHIPRQMSTLAYGNLFTRWIQSAHSHILVGTFWK
jgi:hypothetical protein